MNHEQVEKAIRTTMIGALSSLEENFGHLWAHGVPENELSDIEWENRQIYYLTRQGFLDKGNNQIRKLKDKPEVEYFNVRKRHD